MTLFASLIAIFLVILFTNLNFMAPRIRGILDKLRDDTINEIALPESTFSFAFFMSWHQTCHSLERRRSRFQMWGKATMISVVVGLLISALVITLSLCQISITDEITYALKIVTGLALLIAVISLIEPAFLVYYRHKPSTEGGRDTRREDDK